MILYYAGESVVLHCEEPRLLETVVSMLSPAFRQLNGLETPATAHVELHVGRDPPALDAERPWRRPPRLVMNDGNGPSFYLTSYDGGGATVLRMPEDDSAILQLVVEPARRWWTITAYRADDASARSVARTIKYLFGCLLSRRGCVVLHAAAVERQGSAVLFSGPKRSGKSTLMMQSCKGVGARFISDDMVVLWRSGDGGLRCSGWPKRVAIPLTAIAEEHVPNGASPMRSRRHPPASKDGTGAGQLSMGQRRERLELDADEFLRCFSLDAVDSATPAAVVRPEFSSVMGGRWELQPQGPDACSEMIEPRRQWLFTDYLSLSPEPLGPQTNWLGSDPISRVPRFRLSYGRLGPRDIQAIWDALPAHGSHDC